MVESTEATEPLSEFAHGLPPAQVVSRLHVSVVTGLTEAEVKCRLASCGSNTVVSRRRISVFDVLLHQISSPVVYLLTVATALALYFGKWEEGIAIGVVLALNTLIGVLTEIKALRSIEALRALGGQIARVRRDGHTHVIPAEQLVPGDVLLLEAGDSVAADLRLVEASNLTADESTLTGESFAVDKSVTAVARDARLTDRSSMLFKGTAVTRGSGVGVVVATGLQTELGRISRLVEEAEPGSSPLEKKLARLAGQLVWVTLVIAVLIAGVGLADRPGSLSHDRGGDRACGCGDPGRPADRGDACAGPRHVAHGRAECVGRAAVRCRDPRRNDVILTDKTGTLTENRMTVRRFWVPSGEIEVDGGARIPPSDDPQVGRLLEIAVLCNDATLGQVREQDSGDPMELALLRAGRLAGLERSGLLRSYPVIRKHAFDTATKMMATVHRRNDRFYVRGQGRARSGARQCAEGRSPKTAMPCLTRKRESNGSSGSTSSGITGCACWPAP